MQGERRAVEPSILMTPLGGSHEGVRAIIMISDLLHWLYNVFMQPVYNMQVAAGRVELGVVIIEGETEIMTMKMLYVHNEQ